MEEQLGAQIPCELTPGKQNFVSWHLIFVGPCCGTCFNVTHLASWVFRWLPVFWENGVLEKIFELKSKQWKYKIHNEELRVKNGGFL
jgi:hypothetical protein